MPYQSKNVVNKSQHTVKRGLQRRFPFKIFGIKLKK